MVEENDEHARVGEESMQQEQQLPSFSDLVQRFSLFSESPLCSPQIGPRGSLYCNCEKCSKWHAFSEGRSPDCKEVQYEVFTLEHVKGLAHYLLMRTAEYNLQEMNVLEVGAGRGRLCHHLNKFLSQSSVSSSQTPAVQLTATDSGERGLNGPNVAKKDAIKAISEARPHMVLVSWMPIGVDWTAHMRATPTVLEYILIGEIDTGICGDPWFTWGYTEEADSFSDSSSDDPTCLDASDGLLGANSFSNYGPGRPVDMATMDNDMNPAQDYKRLKLDAENPQKSSKCEDLRVKDTHENTGLEVISNKRNRSGSDVPPYEVDGWVRIELVSLSSFQICRTDELWSTVHHSHTVAFRRCSPGVFQCDTS